MSFTGYLKGLNNIVMHNLASSKCLLDDYEFKITTKPPVLIAVTTELLSNNGGMATVTCERGAVTTIMIILKIFFFDWLQSSLSYQLRDLTIRLAQSFKLLLTMT